MTDADRKRAERQRRKQAGEARVEVWLSSSSQARLSALCKETGMSQADVITAALFALQPKV